MLDSGKKKLSYRERIRAKRLERSKDPLNIDPKKLVADSVTKSILTMEGEERGYRDRLLQSFEPAVQDRTGELSSVERGVRDPKEDDIFTQQFKAGAEKIGTGFSEIGEGVGQIAKGDLSGFSKTGEGLVDITSGTIGTVFSPISATIGAATEGIKETGAVGEAIGSGIETAFKLPFKAIEYGQEFQEFMQNQGLGLVGTNREDLLASLGVTKGFQKKLKGLATEIGGIYLFGKAHGLTKGMIKKVKGKIDAKISEIKGQPKKTVEDLKTLSELNKQKAKIDELPKDVKASLKEVKPKETVTKVPKDVKETLEINRETLNEKIVEDLQVEKPKSKVEGATPKEILTESKKVTTPEAIKGAQDILKEDFTKEFESYKEQNKSRIEQAKDPIREEAIIMEDFARKTIAAKKMGVDINADLIGEANKFVEKPKIEAKVEETTALNKEEIKSFREELGLDKLPEPTRKGMLESLSQAKEGKMKEKALDISNEVIKSKRAVTDVEHAGMVMKAKELRDEYNASVKDISDLVDSGDLPAARSASFRQEVIIEQLETITRASDYSGTEAGRYLQARKMGVQGVDYDLASITQRARAIKQDKLTYVERNKFEELANKFQETEAKLKKLQENFDKKTFERERVVAEKVAGIEIKKSRIREKATVSREKILAERVDIKKQLTDLGFRVNDVTGLTAEGSYLVGKLAVNYIREGAVNLAEVTKLVIADIPSLTERDVYKALNARDPKIQAKIREDIDVRISKIKQHARTLEETNKAFEGVFKKPLKKESVPKEIKDLRGIRDLKRKFTKLKTEAYKSELNRTQLETSFQKINELQDHLSYQHRNIKKGGVPTEGELKLIKDRMADLQKAMNLETTLADLQHQVRTGEYKIAERSMPKEYPREIEMRRVQVNMLKKTIRNHINDLKPKTLGSSMTEIINLGRTAKATGEMSGMLRQGGLLSARRPLVAIKNQGKAIEGMFKEMTFEEIQYSMETHPNHWLRQKADLKLTDMEGRMGLKEELFQSQLAEQIPVYGKLVRASNRHMVLTLNLLRTAVFDEFLAKYPNATMAELKGWANFINVATGRGSLGKAAPLANAMSIFVWAPSLTMSRFQYPFQIFKHWKLPRVRKEIAKDYAAVAGTYTTALVIAKAAGAKISFDPDDPDFGKIRIGNTRIDIAAGMIQPARGIARIGKYGAKQLGIIEEKEYGKEPLEIMGQFASYKLAPGVTVPYELLRGKTMVGEKREWWQTGLRSAFPLMYEETYDAYMQEGTGTAAWSAPLNFVGVSVSTYDKYKDNPVYKNNEKVVEFLNDNDIKLGKAGRPKDYTDEEYEKYKEESGQKLKKVLQLNLGRLQRMRQEDAKKEVKRLASETRANYRKKK